MRDDEVPHESECEQQPAGFPCICDSIADRRYEDHVQSQIEMERGN